MGEGDKGWGRETRRGGDNAMKNPPVKSTGLYAVS